jgi:predicted transglutaminase-like cysteine proteinase
VTRLDRREFLKTTGAAALTSAIGPGVGTVALSEAAPAVPAKSSDLCFMSARELASLIRTRRLSARELMAAYLEQINRVNPKINAIVAKLDDDKYLAWRPPPTS